MHTQGFASAGGTSTSISVSVPSYPTGFYTPTQSPRGYPQIDTEKTLDELIAAARLRSNSKYGGNPYLDNLVYIKQHPPKTTEESKDELPNQLASILDVIGYGAAFASLIPFPAFQIGGRIGYLAANAGSAFARGNAYAGARYVDQISRVFSRTMGNYRAYSKKVGSTGKGRRMVRI